MRRFSLFVISFYILQLAMAQKVSIDYILKGKPVAIDSFALPKGNTFDLSCEFGKAQFKRNKKLNQFDFYEIDQIDLVYTRFRTDTSFSQFKLNKKRLEALNRLYPKLFKIPTTKWRLVEQQKAETIETARPYFHGFVIYKQNERPVTGIPKLLIEEEVNFIQKILDTETFTEGRIDTVITEEITFTEKDSLTGLFEPISQKKYEKGVRYKSKLIWDRPEESVSYKIKNTAYDTTINEIPASHYFKYKLADTVILRALNQIDSAQADKVVLVEDVTGSMAPFLVQTFMWQRLNNNRVNKYVFFNDGDNMPDSKKVIGNTGGIHEIKSNIPRAVERFAFDVMRKGYGGDGPENNIEALIYAANNFPGADTLYLIADNNAPVKDIELLKEVKKPVKVIVCGFDGLVHPHYIQIAYHTNGTLHTIEDDFSFPKTLKQGDVVQLGEQKFKYYRGRFLLTR